MTRQYVQVTIALMLAIVAGACRQADGTIPMPSTDQRNEIDDIAHDMRNVARKDPQAPKDLAEDLSKYSTQAPAITATNELARRLSVALQNAKLDEEPAERLAHTLWVGVIARDISDRQVQALQNDVKVVLTSSGVTAQNADAVADQIRGVQQTVTQRRKRWYEVF
jgi:hypothetical protein